MVVHGDVAVEADRKILVAREPASSRPA